VKEAVEASTLKAAAYWHMTRKGAGLTDRSRNSQRLILA
jgi:hypothetical protein